MSFISKMRELAESKYRFLFIAAISLLTVAPTILLGVYRGFDLPQHVQFSTTFYEAISSGELYPGWAASENLGYGSLGCRIYPPLSPFLMATAKILLGSWHLAAGLYFFLFTFIGCCGVYFWAREYASVPESILAGIFFALMPYRLYEIQGGSQFAEFTGCSIIPFCFLFVARICRQGKTADVFGLAVSFAALILAHLPLTIIGSLSLVVFSLAVIRKDIFFKTLVRLATAVALALAASSAYWLTVATEMGWIRKSAFYDNASYHYANNFLLTAPWFGEMQLWFVNLMFLTLAAIMLSALASIFFFKQADSLQKPRGAIVLLGFALFMCLVISKPIWLTVPLLAEVQFPWRWLTIVSLSGSIVLALAVRPAGCYLRSEANLVQLMKGFVCLTSIGLLAVFVLMWAEFNLNHIPKGEYDAWVTEKSKTLGFEWFWTNGAKENAFSVSEKVIADGRQTKVSVWLPEKRVFSVDGGNPARARIATLYYPHWRAEVNERPANTEMGGDGTILVFLPPEAATVRIWFEEPLIIQIGKYLSIAIWSIFLAFGLFAFLKALRAKLVVRKRLFQNN